MVRTKSLLHSLSIESKDKKFIVLNDANESQATAKILATLNSSQDVVIVSDAGTPLVSDPGFQLIREASTVGIPTVPVPGPSAVATLTSVCPIPLREYRFIGFLAKKGKKRSDQLSQIQTADVPTILFESPHRVVNTVKGMLELGMGERSVFLGREMTKRFEEYVNTTVQELHDELSDRSNIQGEVVLVIDRGSPAQSVWSEEQLRKTLVPYLKPAQIAAILADLTDLTRDEAYAKVVEQVDERTQG